MEVGDGTVFRLPLPFTIPLHGGFFERLESSNRNLEHYSAFHAALSTASCIYLTSALHSSIVSSTNCVSEWNPTTRFTIPLPRSAPTVKYPRGLFLSPILSSILLSPFSLLHPSSTPYLAGRNQYAVCGIASDAAGAVGFGSVIDLGVGDRKSV